MPQQPLTGLSGSEQALRGGLTGALAGAGGVGGLNSFAGPGQQAFALQGAQSGAFGPGAQQTAFDNFISSPGQQFLRDQGEQSILRNASATGGLAGGNVLQELQRQGIGFAAQDFDNQFNRLGLLSGLGANATGAASGMFQQTGRDIASGRTRAGEQIANNYQGTTSALANLVNQQGGDLSQILGQGGTNLANLLSGAGQAQGNSTQNLATILANLSTGQASQALQLPGIPGVSEIGGNLGNLGDLASGIGTAIEAYNQ